MWFRGTMGATEVSKSHCLSPSLIRPDRAADLIWAENLDRSRISPPAANKIMLTPILY